MAPPTGWCPVTAEQPEYASPYDNVVLASATGVLGMFCGRPFEDGPWFIDRVPHEGPAPVWWLRLPPLPPKR